MRGGGDGLIRMQPARWLTLTFLTGLTSMLVQLKPKWDCSDWHPGNILSINLLKHKSSIIDSYLSRYSMDFKCIYFNKCWINKCAEAVVTNCEVVVKYLSLSLVIFVIFDNQKLSKNVVVVWAFRNVADCDAAVVFTGTLFRPVPPTLVLWWKHNTKY